MKPEENSKQQNQGELFRNRLDQILDPRHPLYQIANKIDWESLRKNSENTTQRKPVDPDYESVC
ncbi:hypothetical protein LEP1GSC025_4221 [Leptospira interrogans str. 2002000621]|nr:hypothetical protein LEP1GSC025_4221 [Leptospira interrogans str. 2002000621]